MSTRGGILAVALAFSPAAAPQDAIDWWTMDGGGEMFAAGDAWELSGTLGQWDAAASAPQSGGPWELTGGFWGVTETDVIFRDGFEG